MNFIQIILKKINNLKDWFIKRSLVVKIIIIAVIIAFGGLILNKFNNSKSQQPQYQTAQAEKGTLMVVVAASGQVSEANSATVDTQASGVVRKIYVENGQKVKAGDKVLELDLDLIGKQRASSAWANYQSAKNSLESAKINYYTLQSDMLTKWKSYMDIAQSSLYQNSDNSPKNDTRQLPQFMSINDDWLATEAKYKNQSNVVSQSQTALNTVWLSYQQSSSTVYAPISGTVTGLSLQIGSVLTSQSNTSGTATSQKIASIQTGASPITQVNLTQIDTPKVKIGNRTTLTFDAFPGKTFTGKIVSIDTIGAVSSGVTTYPAVIKLDTEVPDIFSNMTAQANIITQVKDNVILVPSGAVQTSNGQSTVRVLRSRQVISVPVEVGDSNDTQTEIISGVSEGDAVVTGSISTDAGSQASQQQGSPFGGRGFGGGGLRPGFGGGGASRGGGGDQH